jgi:NDP-hexose-3-ketoreductase
MKKNIGFWSFSNHLQKKVIPSIQNNKNIILYKLLTSKKIETVRKNFFLKKKITKNKINFLKDKKFDTVYISSISKNHFKDCLDSIKFNKNVLCEKPICQNKKDFEKLLLLSKKKRLKIQEIYQYVHHPLFVKIKTLLKKKIIGEVKYIESSFKIPLNDKKNFRFHKKLGGGALMDVGAYPLSIPFFLFKGSKYKIIKKKINTSKTNRLDTSGGVILNFGKKYICNFSWGFNMPYENYVKIVGINGSIYAKFIFSKKIIQGCELKILTNNKYKTIIIKKANQINLAFNYFLNEKKNREYNRISLKLLEILDLIKKK